MQGREVTLQVSATGVGALVVPEHDIFEILGNTGVERPAARVYDLTPTRLHDAPCVI
jgi:hypothetical protein